MERIRRRFLLAGSALVAAPLAAVAQPSARIPRIGFLSLDFAGNPRGGEYFRQGLRDLGYVEGRNIIVEYRDPAGRPERVPALVSELVAMKVDIIVAPSVIAAKAARNATGTIPIIFAGLTDPVADGLVTSLARPGGNVTGLSSLAPELMGKRLELLKQAVPRIGRIALLWQPGAGGEDRSHKEMLKEAEAAAGKLDVKLTIFEARDPADFDRAFAAMANARADGLTVLGSPMLFVARRRLVQMANANRLPAVYFTRQYVEAGGLMAYGASLDDLTRRAATYVDRILKGAKPGDLPVEQPTKFDLIVNLKTAKALGLAIPPALLGRADEKIE